MSPRLKTLAFVAAFAATAAAASAVIAASAGNNSAAPEFAGIDKWLNSAPLSMRQLRGKVVLVDFWTYSCINCIHTLPYVEDWHWKYKDKGLVVVGVHTPEYPFESSTDGVKAALKQFGIRFPVAQDNNYATWNAYGNQFWPALYLIDKQGRVVYRKVGEGDYERTEVAIKALLAQRG
jgi:thiol-disulfide isomerase/thioredoxin